MKKKLLLLSFLLIIFLAGFHFYKIHSLKSAIRPLALKDNILIEAILNIEKNSPNITFAEYFEKAQKNIEQRDDVIFNVKLLSPYILKKEIDMYIDLLNTENECVRSEIALSRAGLDVSSKFDWADYQIKDIPTSYYFVESYKRSTKKAINEFKEAVKKKESKNEEFLEAVNKLLSVEKKYADPLSSLIPKRNIIPRLEEIVKENEKKSEESKKT